MASQFDSWESYFYPDTIDPDTGIGTLRNLYEERDARVLSRMEYTDTTVRDPATGRIDEVQVSLMSFNPESLAVLLPIVAPEHVTMLTACASLDDIAYAVNASDADADTRSNLEALLTAALTAGRALIDAGAVGGVGPDIDTVRKDPDAVRRWITAGLTVRAWTVDDSEDAALCVDLGIQQIETDHPRALLSWRATRKDRA